LTSVEDGHSDLAAAGDLIGVALAGDQPVTRLDWPAGSESWLVTDYGTACEMFRDPRFSRSVAAAEGHQSLAREMSVTELDPPEHTRLRRLINHAFSARQIERLRPAIEQKADELLSNVLRNGPVTDFAETFSMPLAFAAQCEVLGVPEERRRLLRGKWLRRTTLAEMGSSRLLIAELDLQDYVSDILADEEALSPGLFGELVTACREQDLISETELTGIALSFMLDGPLLAANQLTNTVHCLLTHPGQLSIVRDDPAVLDRAIEELLRFCPASTASLPRVATETVVLGTNRIEAGEVTRVALPLVNRDPAMTSTPDRLDLTRADGHHLTFGHGVHYCLGAHLTRLLMHVTLSAVPDRIRELSLALPEDDLLWHMTPTRRTVRELPVSWHDVTG
jgi:cytochrome P450